MAKKNDWKEVRRLNITLFGFIPIFSYSIKEKIPKFIQVSEDIYNKIKAGQGVEKENGR